MRKALYISTLVAFAVSAVVGGLYVSDLSRKLAVSERLNADFALKAKCSESAAKFYKADEPSKDLSQGVTSYYINHWNKKLRKCFIQLNSVSSKDGALFIDVYDVLEHKRYATFGGHQTCDPILVGANGCAIDSGVVWLDGDDTRDAGDYSTGNVSGNGHAGNADTKRQFLKQIHALMND